MSQNDAEKLVHDQQIKGIKIDSKHKIWRYKQEEKKKEKKKEQQTELLLQQAATGAALSNREKKSQL